MDSRKTYKDILKKTAVVKVPKHRISTFGLTKIHYFFVSQVPSFPDRSRLREGFVTAESPKIITPDALKDRFEGFGDESKDFDRWLSEHYGSTFRGLQYRFKNEFHSAKVEYLPLKTLTENVRRTLAADEFQRSALIQGLDATWQTALMKFIVDECMRSFEGNLRELDEHGFFDAPKNPEKEQKKEIENLFAMAEKDTAMLALLGRKLRESGLFKDYEDRFFSLISRG